MIGFSGEREGLFIFNFLLKMELNFPYLEPGSSIQINAEKGRGLFLFCCFERPTLLVITKHFINASNTPSNSFGLE